MLCTNVICNGSFPARTFSIYFSFSLYSANIAGPNFALIVVCVCVGWREREKKTFYVRFQLRALIDKLYGPTCLAKGITLNAFQVFPLMRTESRLPYIHCNVCFFCFFLYVFVIYSNVYDHFFWFGILGRRVRAGYWELTTPNHCRFAMTPQLLTDSFSCVDIKFTLDQSAVSFFMIITILLSVINRGRCTRARVTTPTYSKAALKSIRLLFPSKKMQRCSTESK